MCKTWFTTDKLAQLVMTGYNPLSFIQENNVSNIIILAWEADFNYLWDDVISLIHDLNTRYLDEPVHVCIRGPWIGMHNVALPSEYFSLKPEIGNASWSNLFSQLTLASQQTVEEYINELKESNFAFCSYNANPHLHRCILVEAIVKKQLTQYGVVTMRKWTPDDPYKHPYQYYDNQGLYDEPEEWMHLFHQLQPESRVEVPKSYSQCFVDIVSESTAVGGFFPTEKTWRAISRLKPFLCVSTPNYHANLKKYFGIELYTEIFDYSFDQEQDIYARVEMITEQLQTITRLFLDQNEVDNIVKQISPKLIHNHNSLHRMKYPRIAGDMEKAQPVVIHNIDIDSGPTTTLIGEGFDVTVGIEKA